MTDEKIEQLLEEGRGRRNHILLLQARAALIERAEGLVKVAGSRGFTESEDAEVEGLLKRAADIAAEVRVMHAAFEKAVGQGLHPVRQEQF